MPANAELTPERASENRSANRKTIRLEVKSISAVGRSCLATVSNISSTGLLLASDVQFMIGERILVDLPHIGSTEATIIWAGDRLFGCRFSTVITRAALGAAQLQSFPEKQEAIHRLTMADQDESFCLRLRKLRKQKGIGVGELASLLAVSKPSIWNWETGKARPQKENLQALAQALGTSVPELLFGKASGQRADENPEKSGSATDAELAHSPGYRSPKERETKVESRLGQLIAASKEQIAALAGTDAAKVKILIEF